MWTTGPQGGRTEPPRAPPRGLLAAPRGGRSPRPPEGPRGPLPAAVAAGPLPGKVDQEGGRRRAHDGSVITDPELLRIHEQHVILMEIAWREREALRRARVRLAETMRAMEAEAALLVEEGREVTIAQWPPTPTTTTLRNPATW